MSDELITLVLNEVRSISGAVTDLQGEVGGLRHEVGGLRGEVGGLRDQVGSLRTGLGKLSIELAAVRADVMGRIDRLQERLESVRDDLVVNLGQAQRAEQIALNVREETRNEQKEFRLLAEQVSGLQRAIFRINTRLDQLDKPGQ